MNDSLETGSLEVNIEEIIQEIRREIREKGYKETDLSFSDIPMPAVQQPSAFSPEHMEEDLQNILDHLNANHLHDIMLPFQSSNPAASVIKKIIQKMVRFLFYPVLAQQNTVNSNVVSALNILAAKAEMESGAEQVIAELQERVKVLEAEVDRLKSREVRK